MGVVRSVDATRRSSVVAPPAARRPARRAGAPARQAAATRVEPLEGRVLFALSPVAPEFLVNTSRAGQNAFPDVAVDADGDAVVVWNRFAVDANTVSSVWAQTFDRQGLPRGTEFQVSGANSSAGNPLVSMDENGDFVVVWAGGPPAAASGIYARRFNVNGVPYAPQFRVDPPGSSPGPTLNARDIAIASDDAGDFVIAWPEAPAAGQSFQTVRARRFDVRTDPYGDAFRVDTSDDQRVKKELSAAMDADGDFVIVWNGEAGDGTNAEEINARRFNKLGQPQGDDFRVDVAGVRPAVKVPAVAMADDGRFLVAWDDTGTDPQPQDTGRARLYDAAGAPRGAPFLTQFSTAAFGTTTGPDVAASANGGFVIAFGLNFPYNGPPVGGGPGGGGGFSNGLTEQQVYVEQLNAAGDLVANGFTMVSRNVTLDPTGFISIAVEGDMSDGIVAWDRSDDFVPPADHNPYAMLLHDDAVAPDPDPGPEPVNTAPTTTGIPDVTVGLDAPNTTVPLFNSFADAQDPDASLRYRVISNNNANLFSSLTIDPTTGVLTLDYAPGVSGTATLLVQATDLGSMSVETPFNVTVSAGPLPPPPPPPDPGGPPLPSLVGTHSLVGRAFQRMVVNGRGKGRKVGVPSLPVFLDSDDDGVRDSNEPAVVTAGDGSFVFSNIAAGRYRVRPTDPNAWRIVLKGNKPLKAAVITEKRKKPARLKPLMLQAL